MRNTLAVLALLLLPAVSAATTVVEVAPRVFLVEDHTLPIVTVKTLFENAGSAYDPASKSGLANYISSMLDEGAGDMDSLAYHNALEGSAIRFGIDAQEDTLTVGIQTLTEYKDTAFRLYDLALSRPRFDADAITRMRAALTSSLRQFEEDPGYLASREWKKQAYPNHPYGNPRRGTPESIAAITRADLDGYFKAHIACGPRIVSVVGDITSDEVKKWLASSPLKAGDCAAKAAAVADRVVADGAAQPVRVPIAVPQTVVTASLPGMLRGDANYYAMVVLNHIFGGGTLTARLGRELRETHGLAYYAESETSTLDHTGFITVQFATRNDAADKALALFREQLQKIAGEGVTSQELAEAKSYLTGSFPLQIDNQGALANYLLIMEHFHLGHDYLDQRNVRINAVTLEQVNAAAHSVFTHPPLIVMAGPVKGKNP